MTRWSGANLAEFIARGSAASAAVQPLAGPPAKRRAKHDEDQIQRAVCQFWAMAYPDTWCKTWHTPNGLAARNPKLAAIFIGLGMKPGVFDLVCIARRGIYHGFALELKSGRGRASTNQQEWARFFTSEGWLVAMAFTLDAAIEHVRRYHELPAAS